jgi:hypothetical protein
MRVGDRAVAIMPIVDKINFAGRAQAQVDLGMRARYDKGKAVSGEFEIYRRAVTDLKTAYKKEKGFLKMSIVTGKMFDWRA